jgi:hypothetical protein
MTNVEFVINPDLEIPRIVMLLEPEVGGDPLPFEIDDIKRFYSVLSSEVLEKYLNCIENKMIEYVSGIVYDNSSRDALSRLNVLTNIRDDLRVYLYPPEQQKGELNG